MALEISTAALNIGQSTSATVPKKKRVLGIKRSSVPQSIMRHTFKTAPYDPPHAGHCDFMATLLGRGGDRSHQLKLGSARRLQTIRQLPGYRIPARQFRGCMLDLPRSWP